MLRAFQAMAVGDAFGHPFEFNNPTTQTVRAALQSGSPLGITDDTQMALYGLVGLSNAAREGLSGNGVDYVCQKHILPQYLAWYETQAHLPLKSPNWLAEQPLMQVVRAPGSTCMNSLRALHSPRFYGREKNDSKGNGAVMRSLPFVFAPQILGITEDEATDLARKCGKLTHDHSESDQAVEAFMFLAFRLLERFVSPAEAVIRTREKFWPMIKTVREASVKSICEKENTFTAIPAFKAALVAYAYAHYYTEKVGNDRAYKQMLVDCCANVGDSDTIGALAGALWGIAVGGPPTQLLERLLERDILAEVVSRTPIQDGVDVRSTVPSTEKVQHQ